MKILLADDHSLVRDGMRMLIQHLVPDAEVIEAQDAASLVGQASAHPDIGLILLDLSMPGVTGFSALAEMRERFPDVPVVVISAHEDAATILGALDQGAMGFIPKTFSSELMLRALELVLAGGVFVPPAALRQPQPARPAAAPPSGAPPLTGAGTPEGPTAADLGLTPRQFDVLRLIIQGKPNKTICRELGIEMGTVKTHIAAVLRTLDVQNRTQALLAVSQMGLKLR